MGAAAAAGGPGISCYCESHLSMVVSLVVLAQAIVSILLAFRCSIVEAIS